MLSSGAFCSDEDMVITILHSYQQSLRVPGSHFYFAFHLLSQFGIQHSAQWVLVKYFVLFVFLLSIEASKYSDLGSKKQIRFIHLSYGLHFPLHLLSSPLFRLLLLRLLSGLLSWTSPTSDRYFIGYIHLILWLQRFLNYLQEKSFQENTMYSFLKITISKVQFWKLKIDCLIPPPPRPPALLCCNEV